MSGNGALVTTDWVAAEAAFPAYRVVEVDEDTEAYAQGHIPGAIAWHWRDDLHDHPRRDFLDREGSRRCSPQVGLGHDDHRRALRRQQQLVRHLRLLVLKLPRLDRVALMDGGRMKWELEGREQRPRARGQPGRPEAAGPQRPELRASATTRWPTPAGRRARWWTSARPAEYAGEVLAPPHLPRSRPGAAATSPARRTSPWAKAVDARTGTFKSADELRRSTAEAASTPTRDVIAYCRIGERSSHTWFVLHELLGYHSVRNYDGSWTEYGNLVGVPVERAA